MKLVTNGRLITRDASAQGYYEHGAVAFEGTKIVEVGEEAALRAKYPGAEIIDACRQAAADKNLEKELRDELTQTAIRLESTVSVPTR